MWGEALAAHFRDGSMVSRWADYSENWPKIPFHYVSHRILPPAVLQVCKESRIIGLKYYSLSFNTRFETQEGLGKITIETPARIYVNWECDIICPILPIVNQPCDVFDGILGDLGLDQWKIRRMAMAADAPGWITKVMLNASLEEVIIYSPHKRLRNGHFQRHAPFKLTLSGLEGSVSGDTQKARAARQKMEKLVKVKGRIEENQTNMGIAPECWASKAFPKVSLMKLEIQDGHVY